MNAAKKFSEEEARQTGEAIGIDWDSVAHLNEFADYYTRLERMEAEAEREAGQG